MAQCLDHGTRQRGLAGPELAGQRDHGAALVRVQRPSQRMAEPAGLGRRRQLDIHGRCGLA